MKYSVFLSLSVLAAASPVPVDEYQAAAVSVDVIPSRRSHIWSSDRHYCQRVFYGRAQRQHLYLLARLDRSRQYGIQTTTWFHQHRQPRTGNTPIRYCCWSTDFPPARTKIIYNPGDAVCSGTLAILPPHLDYTKRALRPWSSRSRWRTLRVLVLQRYQRLRRLRRLRFRMIWGPKPISGYRGQWRDVRVWSYFLLAVEQLSFVV